MINKTALKTNTSNRRKFFIMVSVIAAIAIFIGGYYVIASRIIKYDGIELSPSKDYPVNEITYYLQNDPQWAVDKIGHSNSSMGGAGCLITCIASAVSDLGIAITPQEVNERLTAVDGYDGNELIWYKINEAIPEVEYKYSRLFSRNTIEKDLRDGLLPIVNVKLNGNGITHWLLIVGAKDGDFLVFDPLNKAFEPIPLSTHGKVYAYRILYR
jgi:hypothetical protein